MGAEENETTYYVGSVEFMVKANGTTVAKRYVGDAVITRYSDNINKISYLHRDHLGSVQTVTSQNYSELTTEHLSYDAYGRRRDAGNNASIINYNPIGEVTKRGYTGQEHVDQLGVINYNARLYDPELGMMLQADTIIPDGPVTQSLNRYSYVFNNPLSYTDPTGHNPSALSYGWPAFFYAHMQDALNTLDQVQQGEVDRHHAEQQQMTTVPEGINAATVEAHQGARLGQESKSTGVNAENASGESNLFGFGIDEKDILEKDPDLHGNVTEFLGGRVQVAKWGAKDAEITEAELKAIRASLNTLDGSNGLKTDTFQFIGGKQLLGKLSRDSPLKILLNNSDLNVAVNGKRLITIDIDSDVYFQDYNNDGKWTRVSLERKIAHESGHAILGLRDRFNANVRSTDTIMKNINGTKRAIYSNASTWCLTCE